MHLVITGDSQGLVPIVLGPNTPAERPYRGGRGIAELRGVELPDDRRPEDFVASTTEVAGGHGVGLTVLPDGRLLRDAVEADPVGWLGPDHVARFGADTGLLVKLLDTAERLFVHVHPDDEFAAARLGARSGKTEAWIITAVDGEGAIWLGFERPVDPDEVERWYDDQDVDAMLRAMRRFTVAPGDTVLVPAGLPHAIGAGITLVELQQPVDLSILIERRGLDERTALLGLPKRTALAALRTAALADEELVDLRSRRAAEGATVPFPPAADRFFRAEVVDVRGDRMLDAGFAVLVVLEGDGRLVTGGAAVPVRRGTTVVVPHGAGAVRVEGDLRLVRARPPVAEAAR
ncbi:class I mannose-6-phosphate isomerase [Amnibacterium kyonggiense]